eukprot:TRINITY_DN91_c0_g4_i1.p1 TRINITY_DN91_c0_g4~~TRINITY_DN91_c0_g4_i1.p1  ORF type:complete len:195 (-),score=42.22 TRINITY_DN91_c0_g4_i1:348-932(-)
MSTQLIVKTVTPPPSFGQLSQTSVTFDEGTNTFLAFGGMKFTPPVPGRRIRFPTRPSNQVFCFDPSDEKDEEEEGELPLEWINIEEKCMKPLHPSPFTMTQQMGNQLIVMNLNECRKGYPQTYFFKIHKTERRTRVFDRTMHYGFIVGGSGPCPRIGASVVKMGEASSSSNETGCSLVVFGGRMTTDRVDKTDV